MSVRGDLLVFDNRRREESEAKARRTVKEPGFLDGKDGCFLVLQRSKELAMGEGDGLRTDTHRDGAPILLADDIALGTD